MPTDEEVAAAMAAYTGQNPFAQGLTSTDYRALIETYGQGETCTFLKGIPVDDARNVSGSEAGRVYVTASLASTVRIFIHTTMKEEQGGEWGVLPVGTTMMACMPADMWPVRGDRFILTERVDRARVLVTRDADTTDVIQHSPLVSVVEIRNGSTLYSADEDDPDYTVSGQTITWTGATKPANGVRYSVEFEYRPTYEYYPLSERLPRVGADGEYLPLRGMLTRAQVIGA